MYSTCTVHVQLLLHVHVHNKVVQLLLHVHVHVHVHNKVKGLILYTNFKSTIQCNTVHVQKCVHNLI